MANSYLSVRVGVLRKALDRFIAAPGLPAADRNRLIETLTQTYSSNRKREGGLSLWQDPEGYISDSWILF